MPRLRFGVIRHPEVLRAIEQELAPAGGLTCQLGAGRVVLVWRRVGATRWEADAQLAKALELRMAARTRLATDPRRVAGACASRGGRALRGRRRGGRLHRARRVGVHRPTPPS